MSRSMRESELIARAAGYRSAADVIEQRERDRRRERLGAQFEREQMERREHVRRAADRAAQDRAAVASWIRRFNRVRDELRAANQL